jgi:capsular polysaccharide transport system permease protein
MTNMKAGAGPAPTIAAVLADEVDALPSGRQFEPRQFGVRKKRRYMLAASFILGFLLPAALGVTYFSVIATDRYAAGASFVVRGLDGGSPAGDLVSSFTGLTSTGSTTSDSYIIRRFLISPDLVRDLDGRMALRAHYAADNIDYISRFDASLPFEDFVTYWERRITTTYDSTTGIVTYEVQAFDAATTLALADAVLAEADALVNLLSEKAREDSVKFATTEVERAEGRLLAAQTALRQFRSQTGDVNPAMTAQFDAELISSLETQLAELNARIQTLALAVAPNAPTLLQLRNQAASLQTQIDQRRAAIGTGLVDTDNTSTADDLAAFEGLQIEQTFAQQHYASALLSLESARIDAGRQQRYLAIFSRPYLPEDSIYPLRVRDCLLTVAAAFAAWFIASLITFAVRDHLR